MKTISKLLVAFVALVSLNSCGYNNMIEKEEAINKAWSNVENQYQRRSDLIPNLVNTVKGYAQHEENTLQAVVEARSKATQITVNADELTPEKIKEYQAAQSEISNALGKLLAITESYPELKANENFKELQAQLEGTENRISVERRNFNEVVGNYNTYIRKFPQNLIAGIFGFEKHGYFEAEAGSEKAPKVEF